MAIDPSDILPSLPSREEEFTKGVMFGLGIEQLNDLLASNQRERTKSMRGGGEPTSARLQQGNLGEVERLLLLARVLGKAPGAAPNGSPPGGLPGGAPGGAPGGPPGGGPGAPSPIPPQALLSLMGGAPVGAPPPVAGPPPGPPGPGGPSLPAALAGGLPGGGGGAGGQIPIELIRMILASRGLGGVPSGAAG